MGHRCISVLVSVVLLVYFHFQTVWVVLAHVPGLVAVVAPWLATRHGRGGLEIATAPTTSKHRLLEIDTLRALLVESGASVGAAADGEGSEGGVARGGGWLADRREQWHAVDISNNNSQEVRCFQLCFNPLVL